MYYIILKYLVSLCSIIILKLATIVPGYRRQVSHICSAYSLFSPTITLGETEPTTEQDDLVSLPLGQCLVDGVISKFGSSILYFVYLAMVMFCYHQNRGLKNVVACLHKASDFVSKMGKLKSFLFRGFGEVVV